MSFKRDGDNLSLLANLQRQRVTELLATHIPEDEAILLKNGRYSCVVCVHRPIFDTLDILSIHRRGKKHLTNLSKFLAKEEFKRELIEKRKGETGNTTVTVPKVSSSLLKASPYNSCCKRRQKPTDRKLMLDIKPQSDSAASNLPNTSPSLTEKKKSSENLVKSYIKHLRNKESFESRVQRTRQLASTAYTPTCCSSSSISGDEANSQNTIDVKMTDVRPPLDEKQIKKANYYLNLRRDGWKKTLDGKWVKDEDAEFDSDEETPPAYDDETYKTYYANDTT